MISIFVSLVISTLFGTTAFSNEPTKPPSLFIDKGACPFECCTYRDWKATQETIIRKKPNRKSEIITTIKAGSTVRAITGEVHVNPVKFVIKKQTTTYKSGDILWVYTYLGEGYFKVWFAGKMYEEDLGFSPYGGTEGARCEKGLKCSGELGKNLKFTWWVQIQTGDGSIGWTDEPDHFDNKDACS